MFMVKDMKAEYITIPAESGRDLFTILLKKIKQYEDTFQIFISKRLIKSLYINSKRNKIYTVYDNFPIFQDVMTNDTVIMKGNFGEYAKMVWELSTASYAHIRSYEYEGVFEKINYASCNSEVEKILFIDLENN